MSGSLPLFETLGCRLNTYETEAMRNLGEAAELKDAIVVNTCAVTQEAVRQARQKIRQLRRAYPERTLIVTGCAAQVDPQDFASMPEVDHVLGNDEKLRAENWRRLAAGGINDAVQVADIMQVTSAAPPLIDGFGTRARAYVEVQNGCDHRCTFCIIPYGRGNSRSVSAPVVIEQVKRLRDKGFNEIVLTGVDMTSWGGDLPERPRLGDLVNGILDSVPDLPRLRISSIDSIEVDPLLIEMICYHPRLMPHLHLSLQAGDNMILKRMKRRHLREDAIRFCQTVRAARPEIVFGADIIAGFPTESDAMFDNSCALVEACDLTWLHVFPYSIRNGTPAARMPQVARATIKERAARLREIGNAQVASYLDAQRGKRANVLLENPHMGRTEGFAPVRFDADLPVGQVVEVEINGRAGAELLATPVSPKKG